jgi:dTDP-4-amino-4,6-dideoxygalactose transaminase
VARIYLSPPHVGEAERQLLLDAFDSNWIAPLGPHVDAFEAEIAAATGVAHAVALSSGTAALHLGLLVAGVQPGDDVLVPTLTFAATANAVCYAGARPAFVDADAETWNVDPDLLRQELEERALAGTLPAAVVTVDLYGQCADHDPIRALCAEHQVPLIEDAAEALGATYRGRPAGSLGDAAVLSFNGNKIITTSGGGMFLTDDAEWASQVRYLATQAREPALHYEHAAVGFNYRMSNLLAAVGRGQLQSLGDKVARRRAINAGYRELLAGLPGIGFMPAAGYGQGTWWLTVVTIDPAISGTNRDEVIAALAAVDIEARPAWKPMHRQPIFAGNSVRGGDVADRIFERGVCLPSGSSLMDDELDEIAGILQRCAS